MKIACIRYLPGIVGEVERVTHLVPVVPGIGARIRATPDRKILEALCPETFAPNDVEELPRIGGRPCESCLLIRKRQLQQIAALEALPRQIDVATGAMSGTLPPVRIPRPLPPPRMVDPMSIEDKIEAARRALIRLHQL